MTSTFGPHFWPLPSLDLEDPAGLERYRWFARFLLDGAVIKQLEPFVPHLLSLPATMIKTWAKLQPRTDTLLKALVEREVDNRSKLIKQLKKEPDYPFKAYCEWIPQSRHLDLEKVWKSIVE